MSNSGYKGVIHCDGFVPLVHSYSINKQLYVAV